MILAAHPDRLAGGEPMQAKEIVVVLEQSVPAVRGRMRKARSQLLEVLETLAQDPDEYLSTADRLDDWARSHHPLNTPPPTAPHQRAPSPAPRPH